MLALTAILLAAALLAASPLPAHADNGAALATGTIAADNTSIGITKADLDENPIGKSTWSATISYRGITQNKESGNGGNIIIRFSIWVNDGKKHTYDFIPSTATGTQTLSPKNWDYTFKGDDQIHWECYALNVLTGEDVGGSIYGTIVGDIIICRECLRSPIDGAEISAIPTMTYTGSAVEPQPTVTLGGKTLVKDRDYTLSHKNNVNMGTATVIVSGQGDYRESISATFKIGPSATAIERLMTRSTSLKVRWDKPSIEAPSGRVSGYQVMIATDAKFSKGKRIITVRGHSMTSTTISKLTSGKKYYVKVRTFKRGFGRVDHYSSWSKAKSKTIMKSEDKRKKQR